jgi:hypothetical protein
MSGGPSWKRWQPLLDVKGALFTKYSKYYTRVHIISYTDIPNTIIYIYYINYIWGIGRFILYIQICHDMLCNSPKNRATFEDFSFSKVDPTLAPSVPMAFAKSRPWPPVATAPQFQRGRSFF